MDILTNQRVCFKTSKLINLLYSINIILHILGCFFGLFSTEHEILMSLCIFCLGACHVSASYSLYMLIWLSGAFTRVLSG